MLKFDKTDALKDRINPPDAATYPAGSFKDETPQGKGNNGTPVISDWLNDWLGFDWALLKAAGLGTSYPSNKPDTANASDRMKALNLLFNKPYAQVEPITVTPGMTTLPVPAKCTVLVLRVDTQTPAAPVIATIDKITSDVGGTLLPEGKVLTIVQGTPSALLQVKFEFTPATVEGSIKFQGGSSSTPTLEIGQYEPLVATVQSKQIFISDLPNIRKLAKAGGSEGPNNTAFRKQYLSNGELPKTFAATNKYNTETRTIASNAVTPKTEFVDITTAAASKIIAVPPGTTTLYLNSRTQTEPVTILGFSGLKVGQEFTVNVASAAGVTPFPLKLDINSSASKIATNFRSDFPNGVDLLTAANITFVAQQPTQVQMDVQNQLAGLIAKNTDKITPNTNFRQGFLGGTPPNIKPLDAKAKQTAIIPNTDFRTSFLGSTGSTLNPLNDKAKQAEIVKDTNFRISYTGDTTTTTVTATDMYNKVTRQIANNNAIGISPNTNLREGIVTNFSTASPKSVPDAVAKLAQLKPEKQKVSFKKPGNQPVTKKAGTTLLELDCAGLTANAALSAIHGAVSGQNFSIYLFNVPAGIKVSVIYSPSSAIRSNFIGEAKGQSILPADTSISFTGVSSGVVNMDSQPQLQANVGGFIPGFARPLLMTLEMGTDVNVQTIKAANFPPGWTARKLRMSQGYVVVLLRPEPQPAKDANFVILATQSIINPALSEELDTSLVTGFGYRAEEIGHYPAGWYFSIIFGGAVITSKTKSPAATVLITPMPFPTNSIPNVVG